MIKGYSGVFRLGEATSTWDADSPVCMFRLDNCTSVSLIYRQLDTSVILWKGISLADCLTKKIKLVFSFLSNNILM